MGHLKFKISGALTSYNIFVENPVNCTSDPVFIFHKRGSRYYGLKWTSADPLTHMDKKNKLQFHGIKTLLFKQT